MCGRSARGRFAAALRERIGDRSQAEAAREMGVDQTSLSRYLRGLRPSPANARRIALRYPELEDVLRELLLWESRLPGNPTEEVA